MRFQKQQEATSHASKPAHRRRLQLRRRQAPEMAPVNVAATEENSKALFQSKGVENRHLHIVDHHTKNLIGIDLEIAKTKQENITLVKELVIQRRIKQI